MSKKKLDSRSFSQAKRRRRRVLASYRMVRYGINNFSRNAWLTIAATAVMTITLLIVFITVAARVTLTNTVQSIQDRVDMTIYLVSSAERSEVTTVENDLKNLSSVREVNVMTPEQARQNYIDTNKSSSTALDSLNNADPEFLWSIRVKLIDINNTSELEQYVATNEIVKSLIDERYPPSFAGDYQSAIKRIGEWISFADRAGLAIGVVFVLISSLIIFNTIRMAIFNRREEIQMMKLIGAERSFIRGPFVVEAVVYGFIAAIIATGAGVAGLYAASGTLEQYGIVIMPTLELFTYYSPFVLLLMILVGAFIGVVSSLLATRRYLKV